MKKIKNRKFLVSQKAQFWYGDFLVAVLILMIIGMLFVTSIRDITSRNEILKDLVLDASDISSTLMSEGYGESNWERLEGTIGFMSSNKIDSTKLDYFFGSDEINGLTYEQQKSMLGTYNNIWIYLQDKDKIIIKDNWGDYTSVNEIDSDNLVHIKRFVFWDENEDGKGDIYILGVVVWQ